MPLPKAPAHPAEILEDYGPPATPESERKLPDVKIVNAMESHPAAAVKKSKRRNVKAAHSAEPPSRAPASKTSKAAQAPLTEPLSKKSVSKKLKAAQKSDLAANPAKPKFQQNPRQSRSGPPHRLNLRLPPKRLTLPRKLSLSRKKQLKRQHRAQKRSLNTLLTAAVQAMPDAADVRRCPTTCPSFSSSTPTC